MYSLIPSPWNTLDGGESRGYWKMRSSNQTRELPMRVECPHCGQAGSLAESAAGTRVRCPQCKESFLPEGNRPSVRVAAEAPVARRATRQPGDFDDERLSQSRGISPLIVVLITSVAFFLGIASGGATGFWAGMRSNFAVQQEQPVAVSAPPQDQPAKPDLANAAPAKPATPAPAVPPPPARPAEPEVFADAADLERDYGANLAAGDLKYEGKLVEVTNILPKVEKDRSGRYFVTAGDSRLVSTGQRYGTTSIAGGRAAMQNAAANATYAPGLIFYIDRKARERFASLKNVRRITVRGVCRGAQKREDLIPPFTVSFEECTLVSASQ
jgi:ribosomal protein S27E